MAAEDEQDTAFGSHGRSQVLLCRPLSLSFSLTFGSDRSISVWLSD